MVLEGQSVTDSTSIPPRRRAPTPPGFWEARHPELVAARDLERLPAPPRAHTPPRPSSVPSFVVPPKPRTWVAWVCVAALAALLVVVWVVGLAYDLARIDSFRRFELGLARICVEAEFDYERGKCTAPPVSFQVVPFQALPPPAVPDGGAAAHPLPPEPSGDLSL